MRRLAAIGVVVLAAAVAWPQTPASPDAKRHVTPVQPQTNIVLRPKKGTKEEVIKRYLAGDTASAAAELRKDSLKRVYPHYPALTEVALGLDLGDLPLVAFGQRYASVGASATLNLWNRLQPVVELGAGVARSTPDDMNFTYKGKLSPYAKVGLNYNITFKKAPQCQFVLGARAGYSTFQYDITDVNFTNAYWGEQKTFALKGERSHALWGEALAGLRVQVWRRISMGWQVRYHGIFNYGKPERSRPWFVPGYGARGTRWAFNLSVYYVLPLNASRWPKPEGTDQKKRK